MTSEVCANEPPCAWRPEDFESRPSLPDRPVRPAPEAIRSSRRSHPGQPLQVAVPFGTLMALKADSTDLQTWLEPPYNSVADLMAPSRAAW